MEDQIVAINAPLPLLQNQFVPNQLCSICSKISFRALLDGTCSEQLQQEGCLESQGSCDYIRLGTLQRISSTTSCPACRLVTHCISLYCNELSMDRKIYLSCQWVADGLETVAGREINGQNPYESVFYITILVCRHAIASKLRQRRSGGPCRLTGIGAILPVRPHYREGDCGSDIDNNGSVSEGNLKVPRYAYARPVTPLINTRLIQEWIASCITEHRKCCETRVSTPLSFANIRLVDVRKRQLVVHDTGCRYIALSYVWGPGTTGLLTRATLETFSREGSLGHGDLPRTICDAISLVADLGERYLWVDSLCIIQDDHSDKRRYLPMMGEIYNAAMMVVVAAVENAHSGLPGRGNYRRQQSRMTQTIQGIEFTLGQPELWDYLPTTSWSTRGWTYQEAQLARRTIFITDSQVYWSCCEACWCEDRFTELPTQPRVPLVNPLLTNFRTVPNIRGNHLRPPVLCSLGEYCQMATEFSSRSVSDERDIFWAFFGILKSLLSRFPQGYIWGLPKESLDSALLWRTNNTWELYKSLIIPDDKGEWQEFVMPSWCWVSKGTEVWYDKCYESVESMVEWHEPVRQNDSSPLTGNQEEGKKEEKKSGNLQSAIFLSDQMSQVNAVFDFALLHFTTESAIFRMHTIRALGPENHCCSMGRATLSLLSGKDIGFIWLPVAKFFVEDEIQGEFILLSSIPFEAQSAKQESKEPMYNIMLVSWSDDNQFAKRVSWTEVAKSVWQECERQRKTIILA